MTRKNRNDEQTNKTERDDVSSTRAGAAAKLGRNRILTAPLPDPITKSIETIIALHTQEAKEIPTHERILENIATFFGKPIFLYSLLLALAIWVLDTVFEQALPLNLPPFTWAEHGLDAAALLISTGVLVRQTRQENFAEQRTQLMLQMNLLSEQKIAKIISLLEELRADLPNVADRYDPEAEVMQEAADPIAVLEALQENLARELISDSSLAEAENYSLDDLEIEEHTSDEKHSVHLCEHTEEAI